MMPSRNSNPSSHLATIVGAALNFNLSTPPLACFLTASEFSELANLFSNPLPFEDLVHNGFEFNFDHKFEIIFYEFKKVKKLKIKVNKFSPMILFNFLKL